MSYRMHRIDIPLASPGQGVNVGTLVNQFLDINQFTSVLSMSISYKEGRRRGGTGYLNLLLREGGVRHYALQFNGPTLLEASNKARQFFFTNDTWISVASVVLQPPTATPNIGSLLVVYTAMRDLIRTTRPGAYSGYAPVGADLPAGQWGTFRNIFDPIAPQVTALNMGNVDWPQGRPGILYRSVRGCPDGNDSFLSGVAPCCGTTGALAASPATLFVDCGCIPGLPGPDYLVFANTAPPPPSSTTVQVPSPPGPGGAFPSIADAPTPAPVPPPSTSSIPTSTDCPFAQPTYALVITGQVHGCNYPESAIQYERLPVVPLTDVAFGIGPRNAPACVACYSHYRFVEGLTVDSDCDYDALCANAQLTVDPSSAGPGGACSWSTVDDGVRMNIVNTVTGEVINSVAVLPGTTGGFASCDPPTPPPFSVFFDGGSQYLELNSPITIPAGQTWTIMIWTYAIDDQGSSPRGIIGGTSISDYLEWLVGSPGPHDYRLRENNQTKAQSSSIYNEDQWYQVFARTRGSSPWALFVNGNNNVGGSSGGVGAYQIAQVGSRGAASRNWIGNLTYMAVWNRDLTGTERNNLYNGGIPADPRIIAASGLQNFWMIGTGDTYPVIEDLVGGNNMTMVGMTDANFSTEFPGP